MYIKKTSNLTLSLLVATLSSAENLQTIWISDQAKIARVAWIQTVWHCICYGSFFKKVNQPTTKSIQNLPAKTSLLMPLFHESPESSRIDNC